MTYTVVDSPVGPLTLVAADSGELARLHMVKQRHRPPEETFGLRDDSILPEVGQQLKEYFAGERTTFDVPLRLSGTPFQQRVWQALLEIPYGEVTTYGQLAASLGMVPGASRAVGLANGKNPVGIIVPCHRVIGSTGGLTGYGGGLDRKQWLLDHERADVLF